MPKHIDAVNSLLHREAADIKPSSDRRTSGLAVAKRRSETGRSNPPPSGQTSEAEVLQEFSSVTDALTHLLNRVPSDCPYRHQLATIVSQHRTLSETLLTNIVQRPADDTYSIITSRQSMPAEGVREFVGHVFVKIARVLGDPEETLRTELLSDQAVADARTVLDQVVKLVGRTHLLVDKDGAIHHIQGPLGYQGAQEVADMLAAKSHGAVQMFVTPSEPGRQQPPGIKLA